MMVTMKAERWVYRSVEWMDGMMVDLMARMKAGKKVDSTASS